LPGQVYPALIILGILTDPPSLFRQTRAKNDELRSFLSSDPGGSSNVGGISSGGHGDSGSGFSTSTSSGGGWDEGDLRSAQFLNSRAGCKTPNCKTPQKMVCQVCLFSR
jgi:hypothetical protein